MSNRDEVIEVESLEDALVAIKSRMRTPSSDQDRATLSFIDIDVDGKLCVRFKLWGLKVELCAEAGASTGGGGGRPTIGGEQAL